MTLFMATLIVMVRRTKAAVPMVPAACFSSLLSSIVSLPFAAPLARHQRKASVLATRRTFARTLRVDRLGKRVESYPTDREGARNQAPPESERRRTLHRATAPYSMAPGTPTLV